MTAEHEGGSPKGSGQGRHAGTEPGGEGKSHREGTPRCRGKPGHQRTSIAAGTQRSPRNSRNSEQIEQHTRKRASCPEEEGGSGEQR